MPDLWDDESPQAAVSAQPEQAQSSMDSAAVWDDEESEDEKTLKWLIEPGAQGGKSLSAKRHDPRFKTLAERTRALPHRQKLFLKCMMACQMHPATSIRKFNEVLKTQGVKPMDRSHLYRWMRNGDFRELMQLYSDLALEVHGLNNPTTTLLRIDEVYTEAMTEQPIVERKSGKIVGYKKDLSSALKATDQLGRAQKLFRAEDEKSQRVTVVLDFSGEKPAGSAESEVIDGEFEEK
jgi:hypothetical protein